MRRREELKRWLRKRTPNAGILSGLRDALAGELRVRQKTGAVKAELMTLGASAICLDDALFASAVVKDGLASIENPKISVMNAVEGFAQTGETVREAEFLGETKVCSLQLPCESGSRVQERRLFLDSLPRSLALNLKSGNVHAADVSLERAQGARDGNSFLMRTAVIPLPRYKIALLPHAIESVRLEAITAAERGSFLREAEALKGIRSDHAELLVVFRHVPIEVISRMRFVAEKRVLVYSIATQPGLTSTRVHDMAAVRDLESQEVHLIPHHTQFRGVSLH
jgi:hypothetical protein